MYCHPERQSSSANQPSQCSASLELFAQDLLRNQRFRLGLRRVNSSKLTNNFILSSDKPPTWSSWAEKAIAFEVEGSDPYLTYLRQKSEIINVNKYSTLLYSYSFFFKSFFTREREGINVSRKNLRFSLRDSQFPPFSLELPLPTSHWGDFGSDFLIRLKFSKLASLRQWKIS